MTKEEMLIYMRDLSPDRYAADSDTVLKAYITQAEDVVISRLYPYDRPENPEIPSKYNVTIANIAVYLLNKRGAEGEMLHNEDGVNRTYGAAYVPEGLLKSIVPKVGNIRRITWYGDTEQK